MTYRELLLKHLQQLFIIIVIGVALLVLGIVAVVWMVVSMNALPFIAWLALAVPYVITSQVLSHRRQRELAEATN